MKTKVKTINSRNIKRTSLMGCKNKSNAVKTKTSNLENMETTLRLENQITDETVWNIIFHIQQLLIMKPG